MKYAEGFVCAFGVQSWCFESSLTVSDWAAWVQAIGSIGAIAAAVAVVWWDLFERRRSESAAIVQRLQVMWRLAYHSRAEIEYAGELVAASFEAFHLPNSLQHQINALRGISTTDFPDDEVADAVLTAIQAYEDLKVGIERAQTSHSDARARAVVQSHCNAAHDNLAFTEKRLRHALIARSADIPAGIYRLNGKAYSPLPAD
jgi:hypothetical protein